MLHWLKFSCASFKLYAKVGRVWEKDLLYFLCNRLITVLSVLKDEKDVVSNGFFFFSNLEKEDTDGMIGVFSDERDMASGEYLSTWVASS